MSLCHVLDSAQPTHNSVQIHLNHSNLFLPRQRFSKFLQFKVYRFFRISCPCLRDRSSTEEMVVVGVLAYHNFNSGVS